MNTYRLFLILVLLLNAVSAAVAQTSRAAADPRRFGARGSRSDLFSENIQFKWNQWVTFAYEQGYYQTRGANRAGITLLPSFRGVPSFTSHNIRSEFAAIFTF